MISGMLARKIGMSQVFQDNGTMVPVTVLQVGPMTVTQKKNKDLSPMTSCTDYTRLIDFMNVRITNGYFWLW